MKKKTPIYILFRRDFTGNQWNEDYQDVYIGIFKTYEQLKKVCKNEVLVSSPDLRYEGLWYEVKEI